MQQEKSDAILLEKEKGLSAVFDATEKERQRIAKDLHDSVGQQMSGLKLAWSNLIQSKEPIQNQKENLGKLSAVLEDAASEVRDISHQMMPKVLTEFGLGPAIQEMLDKSLQLTNLKYEFEQFNINERFDSRIEVSLYRICQELVNNVIKHSSATLLAVQLFKNQNHLILIVEDNGSGIASQISDGHGILNIKSRLNTINGEVNYEPGHQAGTTATVRIHLV
jgi:signal transduction histidine kinase